MAFERLVKICWDELYSRSRDEECAGGFGNCGNLAPTPLNEQKPFVKFALGKSEGMGQFTLCVSEPAADPLKLGASSLRLKVREKDLTQRSEKDETQSFGESRFRIGNCWYTPPVFA